MCIWVQQRDFSGLRKRLKKYTNAANLIVIEELHNVEKEIRHIRQSQET